MPRLSELSLKHNSGGNNNSSGGACGTTTRSFRSFAIEKWDFVEKRKEDEKRRQKQEQRRQRRPSSSSSPSLSKTSAANPSAFPPPPLVSDINSTPSSLSPSFPPAPSSFSSYHFSAEAFASILQCVQTYRAIVTTMGSSLDHTSNEQDHHHQLLPHPSQSRSPPPPFFLRDSLRLLTSLRVSHAVQQRYVNASLVATEENIRRVRRSMEVLAERMERVATMGMGGGGTAKVNEAKDKGNLHEGNTNGNTTFAFKLPTIAVLLRHYHHHHINKPTATPTRIAPNTSGDGGGGDWNSVAWWPFPQLPSHSHVILSLFGEEEEEVSTETSFPISSSSADERKRNAIDSAGDLSGGSATSRPTNRPPTNNAPPFPSLLVDSLLHISSLIRHRERMLPSVAVVRMEEAGTASPTTQGTRRSDGPSPSSSAPSFSSSSHHYRHALKRIVLKLANVVEELAVLSSSPSSLPSSFPNSSSSTPTSGGDVTFQSASRTKPSLITTTTTTPHDVFVAEALQALIHNAHADDDDDEKGKEGQQGVRAAATTSLRREARWAVAAAASENYFLPTDGECDANVAGGDATGEEVNRYVHDKSIADVSASSAKQSSSSLTFFALCPLLCWLVYRVTTTATSTSSMSVEKRNVQPASSTGRKDDTNVAAAADDEDDDNAQGVVAEDDDNGDADGGENDGCQKTKRMLPFPTDSDAVNVGLFPFLAAEVKKMLSSSSERGENAKKDGATTNTTNTEIHPRTDSRPLCSDLLSPLFFDDDTMIISSTSSNCLPPPPSSPHSATSHPSSSPSSHHHHHPHPRPHQLLRQWRLATVALRLLFEGAHRFLLTSSPPPSAAFLDHIRLLFHRFHAKYSELVTLLERAEVQTDRYRHAQQQEQLRQLRSLVLMSRRHEGVPCGENKNTVGEGRFGGDDDDNAGEEVEEDDQFFEDESEAGSLLPHRTSYKDALGLTHRYASPVTLYLAQFLTVKEAEDMARGLAVEM